MLREIWHFSHVVAVCFVAVAAVLSDDDTVKLPDTRATHLSFVLLLLPLLLLCLLLIYVRQVCRFAGMRRYSKNWLWALPNLCAFVIFAGGLITIIHKYGQCVVNSCRLQLKSRTHCVSHCMLHAAGCWLHAAGPCKNAHNQATNWSHSEIGKLPATSWWSA